MLLALAVSGLGLLLPAAGASISFCTTPVIYSPPSASFSVSPTSGTTQTAFTFDGSSSQGGIGTFTPGNCVHTPLPINSYRWNFGDGTNGLGERISHTYPTAGTYTVTLTVDSGGAYNGVTYPVATNSTSHTVTVTATTTGGSGGGGGGGGGSGGGGGGGGSGGGGGGTTGNNGGTTGTNAATLGKSVSVSASSGQVLVKAPGQGFVALTGAVEIPTGSVIDARRGSLRLIAATGTNQSTGKTQSATFAGAIFKVTQSARGRNKGLTTLTLIEGGVAGAPSYASCRVHGGIELGAPTASLAASGRVLQTLRARGHGSFSTRGRYGSATARGTAWTTSDRCDGTLITVQRDKVTVRDFVRHTTLTLRAGQHYLAKR